MRPVSQAHRNCQCRNFIFIFIAQQTPTGPGRPPYRSFTITLRHTTRDRTPVHEDSAHRRDHSLPDNKQHSQETDIRALAGFEPAIPASERPQTDALDSAASGICRNLITVQYIITAKDIPTKIYTAQCKEDIQII
jgi:hypothetical protein